MVRTTMQLNDNIELVTNTKNAILVYENNALIGCVSNSGFIEYIKTHNI